MKINDNIAALQTYTNLLRTGRKIDKSVQRLSSGYRINSVADDSAGMAISRKMKNQINGLEMASRNALDAVSLAETADGALSEVHAMLQRVRELAIYAANETHELATTNPDGTVNEADRGKIQDEIEGLMEEIRDMAYKTEFNTIKMLYGEAEAESVNDWDFKGLKIHVGANKGMNVVINIPDITRIVDEMAAEWFFYSKDELQAALDEYYTPTGAAIDPEMTQAALELEKYDYSSGAPTPTGQIDDLLYKRAIHADKLVSVIESDDCQNAIQFCDDAIAEISRVRSYVGAHVNRLNQTGEGLDGTTVNTQAALSRIMDTDMALEMSYNIQNSIVNQAAIAILGQANQRPQQVLQLLGR